MKERSPENTSVCISLERELLTKIDKCAKSYGLPRSRFMALLTRHAINTNGALPLDTQPAPGPEPIKPLDLTAAVYDFLLIAIPALDDFARQQEDEQAQGTAPEPSSEIANSKLWRFFMLEREEILRHKYLRSKELGYDIGLPRAIKEWLQQHRALWAAAHPPAED